MNLNKVIILLTVLIILGIGAVGAFSIFNGEVITFDINSSVNDTVDDINITNQSTTPIISGNNSSSNSSEPQVKPEPEPDRNDEPEPPEPPVQTGNGT